MATENQNPELQEEVVEKEATPKKEKKKRSDKKSEIEALTNELAALKDSHLRTLAEYDNFRKRSQREKEALYAECKASVINALLPVADNFDRIFANPDGTLEDYKKGVEMTFKQFSDVFKSLGIEPFGEVGEEFDPNIHNAVMHTEDDSVGENTITTVIVKGYKLGDKIIRPAMVAVAN